MQLDVVIDIIYFLRTLQATFEYGWMCRQRTAFSFEHHSTALILFVVCTFAWDILRRVHEEKPRHVTSISIPRRRWEIAYARFPFCAREGTARARIGFFVDRESPESTLSTLSTLTMRVSLCGAAEGFSILHKGGDSWLLLLCWTQRTWIYVIVNVVRERVRFHRVESSR